MSKLSYITETANPTTVKRDWWIIDASTQVVGRLATHAASALRGKNKPYYSTNIDCGDYVIIINAAKAKFSGNKLDDKIYLSHTGYPGGQRSTTPKELLAKHPEKVIEKAIKGMLPKNRMGRAMYKKLFVYSGADHKHGVQNPKTLKVS